MAKHLVIVESPAKAKTINRYLGRDYVVKSSVGHVRDLPVGGKSGREAKTVARKRTAARKKLTPEAREAQRRKRARAQLVTRMGVDPDKGWRAHYEVLPGKEKVVADLKKLARGADAVYLATDRDREGEAIAWHLKELIGGTSSRFRRVVFNEITEDAIQAAFEKPSKIDENRVNAQQARRFLDRVVGFELSPLLWDKVARGLSAGRVQSVAVRLIVERERKIRAFVPEEYWEAFVDLARAEDEKNTCRFKVVKEGGEDFRPSTAIQAASVTWLYSTRIDAEDFRPTTTIQAAAAEARLRKHRFQVVSREDKPTFTRPGPPFITSSLQSAASSRLGFPVRKTMRLAQRLYEAGHITYMRTDSTNLAREAVDTVRTYIKREYGPRYLPGKPIVYASKATAQEAHEAIRPTALSVGPGDVSVPDPDARRLYDLIWRQFVACQMTRAEYLVTTVKVEAEEFEMHARGRILRFDGHTKVLPPLGNNVDEAEMPNFREGETLDCRAVQTSQHFTKPPARYGEASLVRELEKRGIGRPSTYAAIISTIQERGYVTLKQRRFYAEKIGELVTDRLVENFDHLLDYSFTAGMERDLDQIAVGEREWRGVLDTFYEDFSKRVTAAGADDGMRPNLPTATDIDCDTCGRPMQVRTASTGVFLSCSGYALPPAERCTRTLNLVPGEEAVAADADDEEESRRLRAKRRCPRCDAVMDAYLIDEARKLYLCGNNPDCAGHEVERGTFRLKGYEGPVLACEKCSAEMQLQSGRFGKYFRCTGGGCGNTRKLLRNGQAAPPRTAPVPMPELRCRSVDDHYVLRDGAAGIFLAASGFPKNRETRAPLVTELQPHRDELDPKFHYLLSAPEADPDGNPAVVRFSRKSREQYVTSEVDGKPTTWSAHYRNGDWEVREGRSGGRRKPSASRGRAAKKGRVKAQAARRKRR